jgi:hypothetical protein
LDVIDTRTRSRAHYMLQSTEDILGDQ